MITGDVTASLTVSVGVVFPDPVGEIIFSYTLAQTTLINFTTLYNATAPPMLSNPDANTIYINEQDGDQTIDVYRYSPPPTIHDSDGYISTQTEYYDVVDDGVMVQRYFLGTVTTFEADDRNQLAPVIAPIGSRCRRPERSHRRPAQDRQPERRLLRISSTPATRRSSSSLAWRAESR